MQGMNALLPGEHDWLNGNTPSGTSMTPEPPKNRGGLMNALGAVFKYGAPEAYEQGRQRKATETMGNALAMGNYEDAAQAAFQSGNLDQGMQLRQYAQGQQAAGSEQEAAMRKQQAEGTLSLFSQMEPGQITEFAMTQPTEFERITGMTSDEYMQAGAQMRQSGRDPAEFHQFVVQKAKAELGQMPEAPEPYTLASGAQRYEGNEMVANNPVAEKPAAMPSGMRMGENGPEWIPGYLEGQRQLKLAGRPTTQINNNMPSNKTLSPIEQKMDEHYADVLVDWNTGGQSDWQKNQQQITNIADVLDSPEGENLTGYLIGITPKWALEGFNPEAVDAQEQVEEVVQRNLRIVLGAQFTEKEGERLIQRAYNRKLPASMNAKRVRRLAQLLEGRAQQIQSLNEYMGANRTSAGWNGTLASVDELLTDLDQVSGGENSPIEPPPEGFFITE
jgi:hypothetical protein